MGDVLDPSALDALFDAQGDGTPRTGGRLSFVYGDCCVTVDNGEYLTLELLETGYREERDPLSAGDNLRWQ